MLHRVLYAAGGLGAALWLVIAPLGAGSAALAQGAPSASKGAEKSPPTGPAAAQQTEEYADIQHAVPGAAGYPECVWLGRRVVSLLWRDDIETAFRHLDLYDRFGCPANHIQATFRCLILHANSIDPKAADSLNGRVQACWINPAQPAPPPPPAPAAAAPSPATKH